MASHQVAKLIRHPVRNFHGNCNGNDMKAMAMAMMNWAMTMASHQVWEIGCGQFHWDWLNLVISWVGKWNNGNCLLLGGQALWTPCGKFQWLNSRISWEHRAIKELKLPISPNIKKAADKNWVPEKSFAQFVIIQWCCKPRIKPRHSEPGLNIQTHSNAA